MSFPTVINCILCEGSRPELGGKFTILGYFGILPNVNMIIQDLSAPLQTLCFMVFCDGIGGREEHFRVLPQIYNEAGKEISGAKEPINIIPAATEMGRRLAITLFVNGLVFSQAGTFKFRLLVNGETVYEDIFHVEQGLLKPT